MTIQKTIFAAAVVAAMVSVPATAQEAPFELPEQCVASTDTGAMDHSAMGHGAMRGGGAEAMGAAMMSMMGADWDGMPEHVRENMRRMMISMPAMHEGMMNEDADVAFACGMIAHHQGAIDMAQVLIEHGDDAQMIELAGKIIAAQVDEIEQMKTWLEGNAN
jgi:uncharacterized protein (DUF305 family)